MIDSLCRRAAVAACAALLTAAAAPAVRADVLVVANDHKAVLVNGKPTVPDTVTPDTAVILDIGQFPPKRIGEVAAPASVVGPPQSVAVSADGALALVASATKIDPKDAKKTIANDQLTVIDLKASPPKAVATLSSGKGAAGVSITRNGKLALVANRGEGTVSVFKIEGTTLTKTDTLKLGGEKSGPSHVAIAPDDKMALVSRDGDHRISILRIDGDKVTVDKREMAVGLRPYAIDITSDGAWAAVGNQNVTAGDSSIVALIDLKAKPPRIARTVSVGQTPEGLAFSPDGQYLIVGIMDGSNRAPDSPFYNKGGKLLVYKMDGARTRRVSEAKIGHWSQGVAFSGDGRYVFSQHMVEKDVWVFKFADGRLTDTGRRIKMKGGSAAMRTQGR